ncbi:MAG: DUF1801 domain-containing protein [Ignavibacteria bacterium]|nr:DUF1801 domain-containing protein [Ignavibacteria bacterium]
MNDLQMITNPDVKKVFDNYPGFVRNKMLNLRELVIETARETGGITSIEETLKWGEPSYLTKCGSTIRMDWKPRSPECYAMYFKCTSRLVETFKKKHKDQFHFEGNRAIVFQMNDVIPKKKLKQCIRAALTYHKIKHLKELGM